MPRRNRGPKWDNTSVESSIDSQSVVIASTSAPQPAQQPAQPAQPAQQPSGRRRGRGGQRGRGGGQRGRGGSTEAKWWVADLQGVCDMITLEPLSSLRQPPFECKADPELPHRTEGDWFDSRALYHLSLIHI